ncbi:MAG: ferritin-like domain-containing protein [Ilumatobacteraceae bacterium]
MTETDVGDRRAPPSSRRALIGAGLIGAIAAIAGRDGIASAQPGPADDERELLVFAMHLELTARDLYDAAAGAGHATDLAGAMREQHEAYAQRLAAITGTSARGRLGDVYEQLEAAFTSSADDAIAAAYDLESIAVATHTELVGLVDSRDTAALLASILVVEARHCAVFADAGGRGDDLDALLDNDADPLLPEDLT